MSYGSQFINIDDYDGMFKNHIEQRRRGATRARIADEATAWEMAAGRWSPFHGEILPEPQGDEAVKALRRIQRQILNVAPRIVRTRVRGAIGSVTIGTDGDVNTAADVKELNMRRLLTRAAEQLTVTGITAFRAHTLPADQGGDVVISRLSGYLEPVMSEDDVDRYTHILQVWDGDGGKGYNVRLWSLDMPTFEEWISLDDPAKAQAGGGTAYDVEFPPRMVLIAADAGGVQLGDISSGLELIKSEYALQFRIKRVEEIFGFPIPVARGSVEFPKVWQPGAPVKVTEKGGLTFAVPEGIDKLFLGHDRVLNEIRDFFSMPGGVLGKGAFAGSPSGEALAEANLKYQQASSELAECLTDGGAAALSDYAAIRKLKKAPTIGITPNYERQKVDEVGMIRDLRKDRLIPPRVAVMAIQWYVPGFDPEEAAAWGEALETAVSPESALAALGGDALLPRDANSQDGTQSPQNGTGNASGA